MRNTPKEVARKKNKRNTEILKVLLLEAKKVNGGYNPKFTNKLKYFPKYVPFKGAIYFRNQELANKVVETHRELFAEYYS